MATNSKNSMAGIITQVAIEEGFPPEIALAIAERESNFDPTAYGDNGDSTGMFQINSRFHPTYKRIDNPEYQAHMGIRYLKTLLKQHKGDVYKAIRSYNGSGPMAERYANAVVNHILPKYAGNKYRKGSKLSEASYTKQSSYDANKATGTTISRNSSERATQRKALFDRKMASKYGNNYIYDAHSGIVTDLQGNIIDRYSPVDNTAVNSNTIQAISLLQNNGIAVTQDNINKIDGFISSLNKIMDGESLETQGFKKETDDTAPVISNVQSDLSALSTPSLNHLDAVSKIRSGSSSSLYNPMIDALPNSVDDYIMSSLT